MKLINNEFIRFTLDLGTALIRLLPPELSHDLCVFMMEKGFLNKMPIPILEDAFFSGLSTKVPGVGELQHPIGLAAGFDKNCRCVKPLVRFGFSFMEIGTVTPVAQPGNPKPRMFRSCGQRGLINSMGFCNDGASDVSSRMQRLNWDHTKIPVGLNVGKNKITSESAALDDYIRCIEAFKELAKFFVINISSPNTEGLRNLASKDFITQLSSKLSHMKDKIWIKLDPDMDKKKFQEIIGAIQEQGLQGVVLTNTHRVEWPKPGGQSGHPLSILSTTMLEWAHEVHKGSLPMIASGGVMSGIDVYEKLARGASAVEVYTGFIYRGPWAVFKMLKELKAEMELRKVSHVEDIIGSFYRG